MNEGFSSLYEQLDTIREQVVTANLENYMLLATSLGALGALLYISYRVWKSLANAEPIDVFPLLRPFVLGLLIMNFSWVTGTLDGVAGAIAQSTQAVAESNQEELKTARASLDSAQKAALARKQAKAEENTAWYEINWDGKMLALQQWVREQIMTFLQWLLEVAKLILYTVASFMLLIMTLLGPVVFAFAIFDGFQQGLVSWIARYIHLSLWLPVANILQVMVNSIEIHMCNIQASAYNSGKAPDVPWLMMMFYIIGLIAFTTVPTVSGWVVEAGGGGGGVTRTLTSIGSRGAALAGGAAGGAVSMAGKSVLGKGRAREQEQKRISEIAKGVKKGLSGD